MGYTGECQRLVLKGKAKPFCLPPFKSELARRYTHPFSILIVNVMSEIIVGECYVRG